MKGTNPMLGILASLMLTACAGNSMHATAPAKVSDGVLTGANGMTLYAFDKDSVGSGKSACNGPCATNWPPLFAMDGDMASSDYRIVNRDDGKKQWAFKGKPLCYRVKGQKPGDRTVDGFNNVWRVAKL